LDSTPTVNSEAGTFLGTYTLTAYEETGSCCADGVYPVRGYTIACNDSRLWHRWVYIEGYGTYFCHDTGGMPSPYIIDIDLGSASDCIAFGRRVANVYLVD
jgi:3D (Asp-Asp-Asp) domain-containing protein